MNQFQYATFDPGSSGVLAVGKYFRTRALLWAGFLFAIAFVFFLASVMGAGWIGLRGNWVYVTTIGLPILGCVVYVLLVQRFEKRKAWELAVGPSIFVEAGAGFVFGALFITGMWLVCLSMKLYVAHRGVWVGWFDDLVFDSYISAVLEELAFRAVLFRIFARVWGVKTGVIASSVLFGLAHFSHGSVLGVVGIILNGGVAMALLYVITGRLWMSMFMHLAYDFVETSVLGIGNHHGFLIDLPKQGAAAWMTGGTFGPDASVPGILFGVLINVVLWRYAFRARQATALA